MGYRRVNVELLWDIYKRSRAGVSNRQIARVHGLDKKTVNQYLARIEELKLPRDLDYTGLLGCLTQVVSANSKPRPSFEVFLPLADEIRDLVAGNHEKQQKPMKPKTAWDVVSHRHGLAGKTSYETFKRFYRSQILSGLAAHSVPRIETEPGEETQIDYGQVGHKLVDGRRRVINAYCGKLSCSRRLYIEYVTTQDEVSFSRSGADMFGFFGGATRYLNLDNLKAGVISPDIHDPTLNRTFAELCDHYGVLADPARVRSPKDKAKIERSVPLARELFKRLNALYPDASLEELNRHALIWCRDEYGARKHGTTGIPPNQVFEEVEKACLTSLPAEPFVPARWSIAKVHPDQFIQTGGKYYGLPARYIGKQVDVRITTSTASIYYQNELIRQYPVTTKRRNYLPEDSPAWAQPFVPGSYASFLAESAERFGPQTGALIRAIIASGGNLSLRRAQGCLSIIERHRDNPGLSHVLGMAIARRIYIPDRLRVMLEAETVQNILAFPVSETGRAMARSADYYTGP